MRRRTVLRLLSSALIPGALGRVAAARAADTAAPRTSAPTKWISPIETPGASAPGVSATDVRVGMSAAFKGTAAGLGTEFYRGAQAYYDEVNARGGVHGRTITVVGARRQLRADAVHARTRSSSWSGAGVLPLQLRGHPDAHARAAGDQAVRRSAGGARRQLHRRPAAARGPLRRAGLQRPGLLPAGDVGAGRALLAGGARTFGVYYQIDAYGRSGTDGVARALAARGARDRRRGDLRPRGAKFEDDMATGGQRPPAGRRATSCSAPAPTRAAAPSSAPRVTSAGPCRSPTSRSWAPMPCSRLLIQHGKRQGPRLHARPGQLAGGAELRRRQPARRGGVPSADGASTIRQVPRRAARRQVHAAEATASSASRVHQRAGHRRGAAAGRAESRRARLPAGAGVAQELRPRHRRAAQRSVPSATKVWTACTSPVVDGERWVPIADWSAAVKA